MWGEAIERATHIQFIAKCTLQKGVSKRLWFVLKEQNDLQEQDLQYRFIHVTNLSQGIACNSVAICVML